MKSRTPANDDDFGGYYEDDADEVAELDPEQTTLRARLRQRVAAVFGTSYGISILVHVAILLVLATILIASPPAEAKAELQVSRAFEEPKLEERTPDVKDSPEVPLEQQVETPIIILEEEVDVASDVPRCPTLVEAATNKHLDARSFDDAVGLSGGASGAYSSRFGDKGRPQEGGGPETDDAVRSALVWLANHQSPDGRWDAAEWTTNCKAPACAGPGTAVGGPYDLGVTGLATLAFLGNGNTHRFARNPRFRLVTQRALKWMKSRQQADGSLGAGADREHIYEHAIATMALCEAYAITRDFELKRVAERATAFLIAAQNPGLGWKYGVRPGRNDTSVTGWCLLAVKAARTAGLEVPDEVFTGARAWFVRVTDSEGWTGYETPGGGSSFLSVNDGKFADPPVNTAVAVLGRLLMGDRRGEDLIRKGGRNLLGHLPSWPEPAQTRDVNFYYWYYGTYAMFQLGGQPWHDWNAKMKAALLPMQRKGGCEGGSWDPVDPWSMAGGRVYATAINALTLEIYYRYERAKEQAPR